MAATLLVAALALALALSPSLSAAAPVARAPSTHADGDCEPLLPGYCMSLFPNDYYLKADPSTPTGKRVRLTPTMLPVADDGTPITPTDWEFLDGFSRMMPIHAYLPGVSLETSGLARHWDIAASLRPGAPALLLDAVTGESVATWSELDFSTEGVTPDRQLLFLWPSRPLALGRRYIVAYRGLLAEDGTPIAPSETFLQLRDGTPSPDPEVEGRRAHYEANIFPAVAAAGFARSELVIAWDFTVGSASSIQDVLRSAITDALPRIPAGGPRYRILYVEDNLSNVTARHIVGQFQVPHYLTQVLPGAKLVLDANNRPVYQGDEWAPFSLTIPTSIASGEREPQGIIQFGHGL